MQPISEALSRVYLGSPNQFQNLTVFPLLVAQRTFPDYVVLDEALEHRLAQVTESLNPAASTASNISIRFGFTFSEILSSTTF